MMKQEDQLKELLQEWMKWLKNYYSLIGPVGDIDKLYTRTEKALSKSRLEQYL